MLKIKLGEIKVLLEGLNDLAIKELPIKTSYWVSKATTKVVKEHNLFEENRMKLVQKYGKKNDEGQLIVEDGFAVFENPEEFAKEFHSLSDTDIEINIKPISLDMLGSVNLAPKTLIMLDKMIEE